MILYIDTIIRIYLRRVMQFVILHTLFKFFHNVKHILSEEKKNAKIHGIHLKTKRIKRKQKT